VVSTASAGDPIDTLLSPYKLDNYTLIQQGQTKNPCSKKGGLIIYLHNKFKSTTEMTCNKYTSWEAQFIKIINGGLKRAIILGNIYRPPKDLIEKYKQFTQEIAPVLNWLEGQNTECLITGDTNINLLKINEKEVFADFFNTLTENSFYPKITLPTRLSDKYGTLIDNIFCKLTDKHLIQPLVY
jgi:hypothetical protein